MMNVGFEPADIVIYIKEKGVVLREKSLVAFEKESKKLLATGTEAEHFINRETEGIIVRSVLRQGRIVDYRAAVSMFQDMLCKAWGRKPFLKQSIAVCVPQGIVEAEKKAIEDVFYQSGAKQISMIEMSYAQLAQDMPQKYHETFKTVVKISKDEPELYLKEQLACAVKFAKQEQIPLERVMELTKHCFGNALWEGVLSDCLH